MLADPNKNDRFLSAEPSSLYYFPEIPNTGSQTAKTVVSPEQFKRGPFREQRDPEIVKREEEDLKKNQLLVAEAYKRGMAQGRAEIVESQESQIKSAVASMQAVIQEMHDVRKRDVESLELETVKMAMAIAKKVVGNVAEQSDTIKHVVKQAMAKVNDSRQLIIKLNPKDLDVVQAIVQELIPPDDLKGAFRIESDECIKQGGCMIETKLGDIDARIDQQLKIIEQILEQEIPKSACRERSVSK